MFNRIKQIFELINLAKDIPKALNFIKAKLVGIANFIITDFKKRPKNYVIGSLLAVCCFLSVNAIKNVLDKEVYLSKNAYDVTLRGEEITIKASSTSKITRINPQLLFFLSHPNNLVKIVKGDLIAQLDTTNLDESLEKLQQRKIEIGGRKIIITQEITESPDGDELLTIQSKISALQARRSQVSIDLQNAEEKLAQAEQLFKDKVVVQSFLDEARNRYIVTLSELKLLDETIADTQRLYNKKSQFKTKNRVIVQSEKEVTDSKNIDKQIKNLNDEINKLLTQKQEAAIYADLDIILTKVNIFEGKKVKEGDILIQGIDSNTLAGIIKLKDSDLKLIKADKVKITYEDRITGIQSEIHDYKLKKNELSFKLPSSQAKSKSGKVIIERVKK